MADKKLNIKGIPMQGTDGKYYDIPVEEVEGALKEGGKIVRPMQGTDGKRYWIPTDEVEGALQEGGKLLQNDGTPYAAGQEPRIVGHNQAGQPIWGTQPEPESRGLVGSTWDALKGAYLGLGRMLDPERNEYEKEKGLTSPYDYALYPFERFVEPNAQAAERAAQEFQQAREAGNPTQAREHRMMGTAEEAAAAIAGVGPWAASVGEKAGEQIGEGNPAGAEGTVLGNLAVAAVPEVVRTGADAYVRAGGLASIPDRLAELQAPRANLDKPIAPGDLTPAERYEAAKDMGVNLDRAQATNAPRPGMAKQLTEHSLAGKGKFEENREANVQALHQHASGMLDSTAPAMTREEFGNRAQAKLQRHRASLNDEPGQQSDAQALLDSASPNRMTREQFGDAVKNAMERHRGSIDEQERSLYEGLDSRLGERGPNMSAVRKKAQSIYNQNKRFYENHPEALSGADARVWKWVKDLAGEGKKADTVSTQGAATSPDTWADLQRARSHLLDLTRGPEFVGDLATGWAKQLTGAIDETMTSAEHTPGLSRRDIQDFRTANSLHKELKETYDNPQNPFYWISREGGIRSADRLNSLQPKEVEQFNDAMRAGDRKDLVGQLKRQAISRLFDPAGNGELDLGGLSTRWNKAPKEQATGILGPGFKTALDGLADRAKQDTVYDAPGSRLAQVIDAPDGLAASKVMFNDNGSLRLTPEDVRTMEQADPDLIPQLRRQAISRMFDPSGNGTPDLGNFASRWSRAQKEPLQGVLTSDQLQDLDDLASVTRAVNLKSNPSGTAVMMRPALEAGGLVSGLGTGIGLAAGGHPLIGATTAALPIAETVGSGAVASRLVNPEATAAVMEHAAPKPVSEAVSEAAQNFNPTQSAIVASMPASQPSLSTADKFRQMTDARRQAQPQPTTSTPTMQPSSTADKFRQTADQRRGVSTPPNGGQVISETTAEPNEVHDEAAAQRVMQAAEKPATTGPGFAGQSQRPAALAPAAVYTGSSAGVETPEGATHEVLHPDDHSLLGHVVNGQYVPLAQ